MPPLLKPAKNSLIFWTLAGLVAMPCPFFVSFWTLRASRAEKAATTNNFRGIKDYMVITWSYPSLEKKSIYELDVKAIFELVYLGCGPLPVTVANEGL